MFDIRDHGGAFGGGNVSKIKSYKVIDTNLGRFGLSGQHFMRGDSQQFFADLGYMVRLSDNGNYAWFINVTTRTLYKVVVSTRAISAQYAIHGSYYVRSLHIDETRNKVYVMLYDGSNSSYNYVYIYNMATSTGFIANSLPTNNSGRNIITIVNNKLVVANSSATYIFNDVDSLTTSSLVSTAITTPAGLIPYSVKINESTNKIFMIGLNGGNLCYHLEVNLTTNTQVLTQLSPSTSVAVHQGTLYIDKDGQTCYFVDSATPKPMYKVSVINGVRTVLQTWSLPTEITNFNQANAISSLRSCIVTIPDYGLCLLTYNGIYIINSDGTLTKIYNNMYGSYYNIAMNDYEYSPNYDAIFNCSYQPGTSTTNVAVWLFNKFKFV